VERSLRNGFCFAIVLEQLHLTLVCKIDRIAQLDPHAPDLSFPR
jgi:hypothetical protein